MIMEIPPLFDEIRQHANCACSFCWAVWDRIDRETMTQDIWWAYEEHLASEHGWVKDQEETG